MITSSDSLKAKLKNIVRETNISHESLRKMVMFERLLMRISKSKYNMYHLHKIVLFYLLVLVLLLDTHYTHQDMDLLIP